MDAFLGKLTQQAVNYAIRSGITITAGYAIGQCSRLLKTVDGSSQRDELMSLQERLDTKIKIISPAIDLIELISARGNTTLESAVSLTKRIRWEIQSLGQRLARAAEAEETSRKAGKRSGKNSAHELDIKRIVSDMRRLLLRIEDAVPLINLAITTSGAGLTTQLPPSVSPSRLLQASRFLGEGDYRYARNPSTATQIGPSFVLSLYMLFSAHSRRQPVDLEDGPRQSTWKEVLHKSHVRIVRVPIPETTQINDDMRLIRDEDHASLVDHRIHEYAYQFEMIEDLDDDRIHTSEDGVDPIRIKESFPVHQVSRIFYANTGKILNIGTDSESNNPVLLLKRDVTALPPRRMMDSSEQREFSYQASADHDEEFVEPHASSDGYESQDDIDAQLRHESSSSDFRSCENVKDTDGSLFPPNLDPEWLAFEVYTAEDVDASEYDDDEGDVEVDTSDDPNAPDTASSEPTVDESTSPRETSIDEKLRLLSLSSPDDEHTQSTQVQHIAQQDKPDDIPMYGVAKNSLSLLEVLLRLTVLQQFQQQNHLEIPDELLTFFLQESSTTGMDDQQRRRMRREARTKVGFDPYDESPIKRHGEEYQRGSYDEQIHPYSRPTTPLTRNGTPLRESIEADDIQRHHHTPILRTQTPNSHRSSRFRENSPKPPASLESRYPSVNTYQASPLAGRKVPKVIETLSKSRGKGGESGEVSGPSKLNIAFNSMEGEKDGGV